MKMRRRTFIAGSTVSAAAIAGGFWPSRTWSAENQASVLPAGSAPAPVKLPHFPDRLHAFIWRNWSLVPVQRLAEVVSANPGDLELLARQMGLGAQPKITASQRSRSYITVIRRNWHLLPYEQLLQLLGWSAEHMAFMLREDDFLYIKLGSLKPKCEPLKFATPGAEAKARVLEIAATLKKEIADSNEPASDPLFGFVEALSRPPSPGEITTRPKGSDAPRFCYSYFALYGDPLLDQEADPYPDGYFERLAALGVNGVWLQGVLHKLAPFPWLDENKNEREQRLKNLRALARRAAKHGVGIYLYLNEPRALPLGFFEKHPGKKGVVEGDFAALCTSDPEVQQSLVSAVAHVAKAVPELAGFFTISASENLSNCWSHGQGANCPRCAKRSPGEVIAEVNSLFYRGIQEAKSKARLICWDWGWHDAWAEEIINKLPAEAWLQSVSEWSIPIKRGGVDSVVGEYSISTIGPGPRAKRHWELARKRGLKTTAKIQAGNTWELSAVPYIPALQNVAQHAANLRREHVDGLQLGWTLGGYPSPNLEIACQISSAPPNDKSAEQMAQETLVAVAQRRFGANIAPAVVQAWRAFSVAFSEFPFHGGLVYNAPMQAGPSNLLWSEGTGYSATMVGFPYDDLDGWRQVYPPEVFIAQFLKIADGFESAIADLRKAAGPALASSRPEAAELFRELDVAAAAAIHFRSTANQARFVSFRRALEKALDQDTRKKLAGETREVLLSEIDLARRLHEIQQRDSRIGFEATNHYYYVPQDLLEKILNCRWLLERWLPTVSGA